MFSFDCRMHNSDFDTILSIIGQYYRSRTYVFYYLEGDVTDTYVINEKGCELRNIPAESRIKDIIIYAESGQDIAIQFDIKNVIFIDRTGVFYFVNPNKGFLDMLKANGFTPCKETEGGYSLSTWSGCLDVLGMLYAGSFEYDRYSYRVLDCDMLRRPNIKDYFKGRRPPGGPWW